MKVRLSSEVWRDLEAISDHISLDSPSIANRLVDELLDKSLEIGSRPKAYGLVPRFEHHNVRRRVHKGYLIFFRIEADQVTILHILHGARDYVSLLFPED